MEPKKKDTAGGTAERSSAVFGAFHGGVDEGSRRTGGWFFTVTKELTLEQILDEIQAQLRTQYSIGFVPDGGQAGGIQKVVTPDGAGGA